MVKEANFSLILLTLLDRRYQLPFHNRLVATVAIQAMVIGGEVAVSVICAALMLAFITANSKVYRLVILLY